MLGYRSVCSSFIKHKLCSRCIHFTGKLSVWDEALKDCFPGQNKANRTRKYRRKCSNNRGKIYYLQGSAKQNLKLVFQKYCLKNLPTISVRERGQLIADLHFSFLLFQNQSSNLIPCSAADHLLNTLHVLIYVSIRSHKYFPLNYPPPTHCFTCAPNSNR